MSLFGTHCIDGHDRRRVKITHTICNAIANSVSYIFSWLLWVFLLIYLPLTLTLTSTTYIGLVCDSSHGRYSNLRFCEFCFRCFCVRLYQWFSTQGIEMHFVDPQLSRPEIAIGNAVYAHCIGCVQYTWNVTGFNLSFWTSYVFWNKYFFSFFLQAREKISRTVGARHR